MATTTKCFLSVVLFTCCSTASALFVQGPHGTVDITPFGGNGYTVTSLSGGGTTIVNKTSNGWMITPPDEPATFIYENEGEAIPVNPLVPELLLPSE